ncbi:hypothetical protein DDE01_12060 [Desulfovibrio desulfuricans]|nr:hypothetical protein DDE01_12060 [Desulfovibrio desulfuricans]
MSRLETVTPFGAGAVAFAAGEVKTSRWYDLLDVGCNGLMAYQFATTGSVEVKVQRAIERDSPAPVDVVATTHAAASGIKDVDVVPARFVRFVATEKASAAATLKMTTLFV